jgi:hypothetical protein
VRRWLKFVIALLLVPVCVGACHALVWVLGEAQRRWNVPGGTDLTYIPLLGGALCWLIIYLCLPKPLWIYVLGHELTHAFWGWICEARLKHIKVTASGGHVVLTRVNFLITLAPYFFPFYAAVIAAIYGLGSLLADLSAARPWFLLSLGAAYSFHVTLTWHALKTEQTDITSQGYFFSGVMIWLGNVAVLLLALPTLMNISIVRTFQEAGYGTWAVLQGVASWFGM